MLMRHEMHEEAYATHCAWRPTLCISPCPYMLSLHSFSVLAALKTFPGLCLGIQPEGPFPLCYLPCARA